MGLLVKDDYFSLIREDNLDVITGEDDALLIVTEANAESEMKSYLNARYDTDTIFFNTLNYAIGTTFAIGDFVYLKADAFVQATIYAVGDLVSFTDGNVYKVIQINTGAEAPVSDPTFFELWGVNKGYYTSVLGGAGKKPADVAEFTFGDTRDALIKRFLVDIVLYEVHSRINPRKIPEFRIERRDDAIEWLKSVADPRSGVNPGYTEKTFAEGQDTQITFGSNTKLKHGY